MEDSLTDIMFDEWVRHVFDRPITGQAWYESFDAGNDWLWDEMRDVDAVAFLTKAFENTGHILVRFSDAQLNQGLHWLISNTSSDHMLSVDNTAVSWPTRRRCIQSFFRLFETLFATRCTNHLSHLDLVPSATPAHVSPLNSVCYMWWDALPIYGKPDDTAHAAPDMECLQVMEQTLHLDNIACQESALHGLGHWQMYYPEKIMGIIDRFLTSHRVLLPELENYALAARVGSVQ